MIEAPAKRLALAPVRDADDLAERLQPFQFLAPALLHRAPPQFRQINHVTLPCPGAT
jgi:hypothetical protein